MTRNAWFWLVLSLGLAWLMLTLSNFGITSAIFILVLTYLLLRFGTMPLARIIARTGYSIRWKFEMAIVAIAVLFLSVSLISFGSMDFMHGKLHEIQELGATQPLEVLSAVAELEDTNHGLLFSLIPILGMLGVVLAAAVGAAMAWSVIAPVLRMGELIQRMASRDFSQPLQVENNDELGELATQINNTAAELARLHEMGQAELRIARDIQQTLLPERVPELPGWEVAKYYQPAREVGGDFYDFLELPNGQLGLVVGDVADKGVPAALVMATTRSILRVVGERSVSPGQVLERVNDMLCPDIPPNMLVTCLYAILDPHSGRIQYANAGHDLPYWRNSKGVTELRATGMPLGLMPGMTYEEKETTLAPGECILLHSDGMAEAHNPQKEMFGFPRLKNLMAEHPGGAGLIDFLLAELAAFTGEHWEQEDDVTLVTLQRAPLSGFDHPGGEGTRGESAPGQPSGDDDRRTLAEFMVPSEPGNERQAVAQVAEAVHGLDVPDTRLNKLKTAVAEATMNAMEHGNEYRPELPVSIKVLASQTALTVRITDHEGGQAIPEPETPDLEAKLAGSKTPRGWGLFLIKTFVDEMHTTSDEVHHTIELVMYLEGGADDSETP